MLHLSLDGMDSMVNDDEINDLIDEWHNGDSDLPLHEYLGMTYDEYVAWVHCRRIPANPRIFNFKTNP